MPVIFSLIVLLLASLLAVVAPLTSRSLRWLGLVASFATLFGLLWITGPILVGAAPGWHNGWLDITRYASLMGLLIGWLYLCAMTVSFHYLDVELKKGILTTKKLRLYMACVPLFVLSMLVAIFANNLGLLWVALETTTLSTTLLVSFYDKKSSMEAAWKYIVICSTGIALGLFGILILGFAGLQAGLHETDTFLLSRLMDVAMDLNPGIVMWAFVFLFVGFGTKIGLVPMHTWLPDAHSKTPAPVSAMLSGILLNVAFFSLLRFKHLVDLTLESHVWTDQFFLFFGVLTILLPAMILLIQRNYKRMLAYHSVEHMGIMAFLAALGPMGMVAYTVHMVGHALSKSALFFGAGELLQRFESTKFHLVHDVMRRAPRTGILFLIAALYLIAIPPTGLFLSEYLLVGLGIGSSPILTALALLGITVAGLGLLLHLFELLFGKMVPEEKQDAPIETWNLAHTVMAAQLTVGLFFGIWLLFDNGWIILSAITNSVFPL